MNVIGYTDSGMIRAELEGAELVVPDDMGNRHRQLIAEWEAAGNVIPPFAPPPPEDRAIDAERDRRISAGFSFGDVFYQSRPEDRENIAGAATAALAAIMFNGAQSGDFRWHGGESDFEWIAADNTTHPLDAQSMFAMGQAAMAHKQAHIWAARAVKDMNPIPADYATNPAYWP
ncbi:DUF4376 domain-containing protein [Agrobacterium tumefaciens]|uniref:DUF4376 domain-containing protein n=1 Tax=Agrobacterium tumefaciens TaxID=358 RepID=UPI001574E384|nr:DUF4376 domain-containing protein [Agrobacterium tumefaciens]NTD85499.1 DUF4376 domain-containing protein [Agrobacterium tumefaciens]NTD90848.1 DUF4376 domain-containing protein [Agrobacterium tumefaciens]NTE03670.1 DUF4376 domain-containing protein [Agrobacterium tumefaciens]NTE15922.1 DUF4376 domain-containing protein [Agrobacterium tumefaciens]NTE26496.1 DUF4376 domain-containing protein [Agrobacterium tumefaciens]